MSTHKGRWYACCGLGKGWHRKHHKGQRQQAKKDIVRQTAESKEKI